MTVMLVDQTTMKTCQVLLNEWVLIAGAKSFCSWEINFLLLV